MWHFIYHFTKGGETEGFPGQRTIAKGIGCKQRSLKPWTVELMRAGWIAVRCGHEKLTLERLERSEKIDSVLGRHYRYELLNGFGQVLPKRASVQDQKGGGEGSLKGHRSETQKGVGVLPKRASNISSYKDRGGDGVEAPDEPTKADVRALARTAAAISGPYANKRMLSAIPVFKPVPLNLFPDEYRHLRDEAERQIGALKAEPSNIERTDRLTARAAEDVAWLLGEVEKRPDKAAALRAEAEAVRSNPENFQATGFRPEVRAAIAAWRKRIEEITAAMSGAESKESL
jgi:hypothetical protein